MRRTGSLIALVGVLLAAPRTARADGFVSPGLGVAFGNPSAEGRANFVADIGWLPPREPLGVELDVTYAPSFFSNQGPFGQNNVTTVMGNVIFAGGADRLYGRRRAGSVRPYLSAGIGLIRETVATSSTNTISNDDLGVNLGVGVIGLTRRQRVGVRGDIRYFRDLVGHPDGNTSNIDFGSFHFWRASMGFVLGF